MAYFIPAHHHLKESQSLLKKSLICCRKEFGVSVLHEEELACEGDMCVK
jgi:hypothetical protein